MMPSTFRTFVSLLIVLLGFTALGRAQGSWVEATRYQQTAYFLFDNRIERYDLQGESWLPSVALPATGAKSIVASERGVFVAIGTGIHRFDTDLGNRTLLTTTAQQVAQLLMDGNRLVATQAGSGVTALFYPLDGGSPLQSNIASSTFDLLGQAAIAPGIRKIFGRSTVRGPLDMVQVTYQAGGGLIAITDSPHSGGALPAGTKTYVMPGETRVADNAGVVYSTANLSYIGSFGGAFMDIAFRASGEPVVLRGTRLTLHDASLRETAGAPVSATAAGVQVTADAAFAFITETSPRGVRAEKVPFSAFTSQTPPAAVDPTGLNYTPTQIMIDRDGVILLYSATHKTVFRWSPAERRYLAGIGLNAVPAHITYSAGEHALYLGFSTGEVKRVEAVPGAANVAFTNVPTPVEGLVAVGNHLMVAHNMYSDYMHRTFDRNGVQVDAKARYSYSQSYAVSPESRTIFWLNDRTSGGTLFSEVIGNDGTLGPELEIPYYKSTFREDPPLRANATGTRVMLARGVLFSGSPLGFPAREIQRASTDMAWIGEGLFSIEPLTGNNTTFNRWTADLNVDQYRALEGTPLRVFPGAQQSIVVTLHAGSPRFHLLDAKDDSSFDSVSGRPPVISTQPQDARTDYGGTARFRVLALGSGPFQYRWTKDGTEIPGANSADLILENRGSKSAGRYQATVSNASGSVTSSVARLGIGPVRTSPYTPGNLLVSARDKFYEVQTNGQIVRTLQVPHPFTAGFAPGVEDLAMDRLGRLQVVHRADRAGYDLTIIGTLDPEFNTWTYTPLREASFISVNSLETDFSIVGNTALTNRGVSVDLANLHLGVIPQTELMNRPNITAGLDGFAYGAGSNGKIYRFHPGTWQLLQTSTADPAAGIYGAAAAANGDIYMTTSGKRLGRVSPGGSNPTFLTMSNIASDTFSDINIARSGAIALGTNNSGIVVLSSTQLQSATAITLPGVNSGTFAGWVEAPVIPAPTFAATPPLTTLEDAPFTFDPGATHADPDQSLALTLEAGPPWLSLDASGKLIGTPLAAHIGTSQVRLKATDSFGISTTLSFNLQVLEVNDLPLATGLSLQRPEDVAPFTIPLHDLFSDEETPDAALAYELVSNSNPALVAATVANGSLGIGPVKDAFGVATLIVRATDAGGLSAESEILLEFTPVNDPPVFSSQVPDLTAAATGAPLALELGQFVFDADPGDPLLWSLDHVSNPALFSQIGIAPETGHLDIGFAPYVSGTSDITVTVRDGAGTSASFTFQVTLPELPLPGLAVNATLGLNRQTGLYEQRVTITNVGQRPIAGFDVIIGGLPDGVKLNNGTGTGDGTWIISHRSPISAGASVVFTLEYAVKVRGTAFTPQISVVLVTAPQAPAQAAPGGVAVTRCVRLDDGSQLIEFEAVPGQSYEVHYSGDAVTWLVSPVTVTAAGNRVQWIDRGPPRTDSPPGSVTARFYRVLELGTAP